MLCSVRLSKRCKRLMADENEKGLWHCANCDHEGLEEEFKRRPDYRSCPKCRGGYVYSLETGPVWSCDACGYSGPEIGFDEKYKCDICPKPECKSEDVFLDCDWQRMIDRENEEDKKSRRERPHYDFEDDD